MHPACFTSCNIGYSNICVTGYEEDSGELIVRGPSMFHQL